MVLDIFQQILEDIRIKKNKAYNLSITGKSVHDRGLSDGLFVAEQIIIKYMKDDKLPIELPRAFKCNNCHTIYETAKDAYECCE